MTHPPADTETARSSIKSEWEITTPWSLRSMKRSTVLIKLSSIQATTPTAMIMTWPWFACRRGQWARCRESVCHSAVTSFLPVCLWGKRECSNKLATVTLPAGVTQVRVCACVLVCWVDSLGCVTWFHKASLANAKCIFFFIHKYLSLQGHKILK